MNLGIVLAAGKGKRFKAGEFNKTTVGFAGKPLVRYATDLFTVVADKIIVVIGVGAEGVNKAVGKNSKITFATQKSRLGTGHAVKVAVEVIKRKKWQPEFVWVGYGDHMMFYTPKIIKILLQNLDAKDKVISMVTCEYKDPESLAWGRIIRSKKGDVSAIIEQKEATRKQKKIKELNAGLYCFRYDFLREGIYKLIKSPKTGEYYLTDTVGIAVGEEKKIIGVKIPFEYVGMGINTNKELIESQKLYMERKFDKRGGDKYGKV